MDAPERLACCDECNTWIEYSEISGLECNFNLILSADTGFVFDKCVKF